MAAPVFGSRFALDTSLITPFIDEMIERPYEDPMIDRQGHTFSKRFITTHLANNDTCPIGHERLTLEDLVPNLAFKHAQEYYLNENNGKLVLMNRNTVLLKDENQKLKKENLGSEQARLELIKQNDELNLLALSMAKNNEEIKRKLDECAAILKQMQTIIEELEKEREERLAREKKEKEAALQQIEAKKTTALKEEQTVKKSGNAAFLDCCPVVGEVKKLVRYIF